MAQTQKTRAGAQSRSKTAAVPMSVAVIVAEYVNCRSRLDTATKKLAPLREELTAATQKILEYVDEVAAAAEETRLVGAGGVAIKVGAKAREVQSVDKRALIKLLGQAGFNDLAEVPITVLRRHLSAQQLQKVLVEKHTGRRTLTID